MGMRLSRFDTRVQVIHNAGPKDIAKLTRALEGVELRGVTGVAKRFFGWLTGQYTLKRLERAYADFLTKECDHIRALGTTDSKTYKQLRWDLLERKGEFLPSKAWTSMVSLMAPAIEREVKFAPEVTVREFTVTRDRDTNKDSTGPMQVEREVSGEKYREQQYRLIRSRHQRA
jgi:hypothetical protein